MGNGTADTWIDGGAAADVNPTTGNWVHFAFAIGIDEARVYINGAEVKQGALGSPAIAGLPEKPESVFTVILLCRIFCICGIF
ncbi:hypothetical protein ACS2QP_27875, partial [Bacillus cereus group sp. Bce019]|uniref:hypothetical protein n=1 Tax=Bacillus cereus group sp. Bce019 TaxID=3445247 RepID=UPI003F265484